MVRKGLLAASLLLVVVVLACIVAFLILRKDETKEYPQNGSYKSWATAIDEPQCSYISKDVYKRGGTVADAAVATMLCLGVVVPESLGIGGGFLATCFHKTSGEVFFLDAREVAPLAATADMYNNSAEKRYGARAIAVPGELKGYKALLEKFDSRMTSQQLFSYAINYAANGFTVGEHMKDAMLSKKEFIFASDEMRAVYWDYERNSTYSQGATVKNLKLAETLTKLAQSQDFVQEFYKGDVGAKIVAEIVLRGGILSMDDLDKYTVAWKKPSHSSIKGDYQVYSAGLSGTGSVLSLILNILDAFNVTSFEDNYLTSHRFIEACKFAYAKRSLLGDEEEDRAVQELVAKMQTSSYASSLRRKINDTTTLNIKEYEGSEQAPRDRGTSHANFFGPNGDVIAITSTVNFYFGSQVQVNGVILNNEMDDFSSPNETNGFELAPSIINYIKPGKRPISSMVPTIIVKDKTAVMAIGGAGGSKITSATAWVLLNYLWMNRSLSESISNSRLHHQYLPDSVEYESGFNMDIIKELREMGHTISEKPPRKRGSVIVAIARESSGIIASVDPRKGGGTSGD